MLEFFKVIFYQPLVNALALIVNLIPGGDIGIAIIILTLLVKIVLYPLSQRSIVNQIKINALTPEINKIKQSGASREEQAKATFELYKKHKTNPFSGCFLILVQIPIIISLYYVFFKGLSLNGDILYSFIHAPEIPNNMFLGLVDLGGKSIVLALLAGISQFLQSYYMPKPDHSNMSPGSFQESFSKSMHLQMKYIFPVLMAFIAYSISGAVALYLIVSNIFSIGQQIYAQRINTQKSDENK